MEPMPLSSVPSAAETHRNHALVKKIYINIKPEIKVGVYLSGGEHNLLHVTEVALAGR